MKSFCFSIIRGFFYLRKRMKDSFWQWYHLHYCLAANVRFVDLKTVHFCSRAYISINPKSNVTIGKAFEVNSGPDSGIGTTVSKIVVGESASFIVGDYSGISSTTILVKNSVFIGNHVNIGGGTLINDSDHHSTDWRDRADRCVDKRNAKSSPIIIGDYVFIGARSMIGKGVKIGEKSIVAAGSVVVKDIPANCLAGGNPCKVIKELK